MKSQPKWLDALLRTGDPVYVVNDAQRIVYWNGGAEKLIGYSEAEVLKRHCYEVVAGRDNGRLRCHADCPVLKAVNRNVLPEGFRVQTRRKDGREVWLNVSIFSYERKGRRFLVHLVRDVTYEEQRKEALEEILVALETHGVSDGKGRGARKGPVPAGSWVPCPTPLTSLTRREIEVLALLADGLTSKSIADRLCVSAFTVRRHIEGILQKTGMHTQAQAVAYAYRAGIL